MSAFTLQSASMRSTFATQLEPSSFLLQTSAQAGQACLCRAYSVRDCSGVYAAGIRVLGCSSSLRGTDDPLPSICRVICSSWSGLFCFLRRFGPNKLFFVCATCYSNTTKRESSQRRMFSSLKASSTILCYEHVDTYPQALTFCMTYRLASRILSTSTAIAVPMSEVK